MKALRIIKYDQIHEDHYSRQVKRLKYVQMPVDRESEGWEHLGVMPGGLEAKGVYLELVEYAATLPIRGLLASEDKPISMPVIARRCRVTIEQLKASIDLFTAEEVAFVDWIDWPVDPRLIRATYKGDRACGRTILPHTIDAEGQVIDCEGVILSGFEDQKPDEPPPCARHVSSNQTGKPDGCLENGVENVTLSGFEKQRERGTGTGTGNTEEELKRERERGSPGGNFSGGDPGPDPGSPTDAQRTAARNRYLLAIVPLLGREKGAKHPQDSKRWRGDRTQADRIFDEQVWPEGIDAEEGRRRLAEVVELADQAGGTKTPMAWLKSCVNKRFKDGVRL